MSTLQYQPCHATPAKLTRHDALEALNDATTWVLATFHEWRQRVRERNQLLKLDEHMLSDIGLSRAEQLYLANKPFWRE